MAQEEFDEAEALETCREQRADLLELVEVERAKLREALHEVWLKVHNRRFDDALPNSVYRGVQLAEEEIHRVAEKYGISYHELRKPPQ